MAWKDLAKSLEARFGLGTMPLVSRRLYRRLQRELESFGEPVGVIISACIESSICATRDQGSWFRSAVVRRLGEAGYLSPGKSPVPGRVVGGVVNSMLGGIGGGKGVENGEW